MKNYLSGTSQPWPPTTAAEALRIRIQNMQRLLEEIEQQNHTLRIMLRHISEPVK